VQHTGSRDRRFDRSSSHSALSSRHQRAVQLVADRCRQTATRVIVADAGRAISLFNPDRNRAAVRSPEARQDRGHRSPATLRRWRCLVGLPARLPARQHMPCRPTSTAMVSRQRAWCMDQRRVCNDSTPRLSSDDADIVRASQFRHAVADINRHVDFSLSVRPCDSSLRCTGGDSRAAWAPSPPGRSAPPCTAAARLPQPQGDGRQRRRKRHPDHRHHQR
jgi:hypothetical protein